MSATLGEKMCEAATGEPCDALFQSSRSFTKIGQALNPRAGESVVVSLSDPINLSSDTRRIVIAFDDDPSRLLTVANQQEGTKAFYEFRNDPDADFVGVWADSSDVVGDIQLLKTSDAKKVIEEDQTSVLDSIGDALQREREAAEQRSKMLVVGLGALAIALIVAAAYVLPKVKIPTVNVS